MAHAAIEGALAKIRGKKMLSSEEFDALQEAMEARMQERPAPVASTARPETITDMNTLVDFTCPSTVQGNPFEFQGKQYQGRCLGVPFYRYLDCVRAHHGDMENFARLRTPMGNQPGTFKQPRQIVTDPMPYTRSKQQPPKKDGA